MKRRVSALEYTITKIEHRRGAVPDPACKALPRLISLCLKSFLESSQIFSLPLVTIVESCNVADWLTCKAEVEHLNACERLLPHQASHRLLPVARFVRAWMFPSLFLPAEALLYVRLRIMKTLISLSLSCYQYSIKVHIAP